MLFGRRIILRAFFARPGYDVACNIAAGLMAQEIGVAQKVILLNPAAVGQRLAALYGL
jgi:hypothetical protein